MDATPAPTLAAKLPLAFPVMTLGISRTIMAALSTLAISKVESKDRAKAIRSAGPSHVWP
jgi:hypothetical protein